MNLTREVLAKYIEIRKNDIKAECERAYNLEPSLMNLEFTTSLATAIEQELDNIYFTFCSNTKLNSKPLKSQRKKK